MFYLQYPGKCRVCQGVIPAHKKAYWSDKTRMLIHPDCMPKRQKAPARREPRPKSGWRGYHVLKLKYPNKCYVCKEELPVGKRVYGSPTAKIFIHFTCMSKSGAKRIFE